MTANERGGGVEERMQEDKEGETKTGNTRARSIFVIASLELP